MIFDEFPILAASLNKLQKLYIIVHEAHIQVPVLLHVHAMHFNVSGNSAMSILIQ
jgi:hypothetical protein